MKVVKIERPDWVGNYKHDMCGAIIKLQPEDAGSIVSFSKNELGGVEGITVRSCPNCGSLGTWGLGIFLNRFRGKVYG